MELDEYARMVAVEDRMWWFAALHAEMLLALGTAPQGPVLDAGCGTGGFLRRLRGARAGTEAIGVDVMPVAAQLARTRAGVPVCVGSVTALPFAANRFAAVVSADVLSHQLVDEPTALAEIFRTMAPGGTVVVNLPAFQWLYSAHDRAVHTRRRYTRAEVAGLLAGAGFRVSRVKYWNTLLFPLMVIQRKILARGAAHSDVHPFPTPIEACFRTVTWIERGLARLGISFPFGGSVLAVGTKPG
jgi:SAM-dependent methyltransferase